MYNCKRLNRLPPLLELESKIRHHSEPKFENHDLKLQILNNNQSYISIKSFKHKEKVYGINEVEPDYDLLNKRPQFNDKFNQEVMSKLTRKRRYDAVEFRTKGTNAIYK
jgi:hypothetical protein